MTSYGDTCHSSAIANPHTPVRTLHATHSTRSSEHDDIARWAPHSLKNTMPHSTRDPSATRVPFKFPSDTKMGERTSMEKFPDLDTLDGQSPFTTNSNFTTTPIRYNPRQPSADRWQPRRDSRFPPSWAAETSTAGHNRQKSLSDAFRTIRARNASVSANVHEISNALKAPVSPKLIVCNSSIIAGPADSRRFFVLYGTFQVL